MLSKMQPLFHLFVLLGKCFISEVRPEPASENKTQDIINGLEMTGLDVSFCYFMLSLSALSKFNTYHYVFLCKISSSLLLCS